MQLSLLTPLMVSASTVLTISVAAQANPFRPLVPTLSASPQPSGAVQRKELKLADYLREFSLLGILETGSGQALALIRQGNRTLQLRDGAQLGDQPIVLAIRRTSQGLRVYARYRRQLLELTP